MTPDELRAMRKRIETVQDGRELAQANSEYNYVLHELAPLLINAWEAGIAVRRNTLDCCLFEYMEQLGDALSALYRANPLQEE